MYLSFFNGTMRLQAIHGECVDGHAVVSCTDCHQLMLEQNLVVHTAGHVSGGVMDPTMHLRIAANRTVFHVVPQAS